MIPEEPDGTHVMSEPSARPPLDGVRVLDFTHVLAGPFASMLLGDLGAEVIKIEPLRHGDTTRHNPPFIDGESLYFLSVNRAKQSVAVDLKRPEGRELVLELATRSDVVLENFRPGVLDRLGVGFERLAAVNPRLILCSISGFGQTGPLRDKASFDIVTQAMSGAMSVSGEPGAPPARVGLPIGDLAGGLYAALAVVAALRQREATGRGARIDIGLHDCLVALLGYLAHLYFATGVSPERVGSAHHSVVPYGALECRDGSIVLAVFTSGFFRKFAAAIGQPDLALDERFATTRARLQNREALTAIVREAMRARTVAEWCAALDAADIPHAPILSVAEALEHPQTRARGMVRSMRHPRAGEVRALASPIKLSGLEDQPCRPSPALGENTRRVLAEVLGRGASQIEALLAAGVIGEPKPGGETP